MQITHDEEGERRWAGLAVNDYPDGSMDLDAWERADAMPEGPEKVAELQRLRERYGGKRRVFLGRQRDRSARLAVNDAAGRPRLVLEVAPDGAAAIRFLDADGKVVRTESRPDARRQHARLAEKSLSIIVVGTGSPPLCHGEIVLTSSPLSRRAAALVRRVSRAAFSSGAGMPASSRSTRASPRRSCCRT